MLFEYLFVCYLCNLRKDNLTCLSHVLFINEYIDIYYHRLFLFTLGLRSHYIVLAGLELLTMWLRLVSNQTPECWDYRNGLLF